MKHLKRLMALIVTFSLLLSLTACGRNSSARQSAKDFLISIGLIKEAEERNFAHVTDELDSTAYDSPTHSGYYVYHDGKYYPLVMGDWISSKDFAEKYYDDSEQVSPTHKQIALNRTYDTKIPTLFLPEIATNAAVSSDAAISSGEAVSGNKEGDKLIYCSSQSILNYINFVKYLDIGYSVPIRGFKTTVGGYPYVTVNKETETKDPYENIFLASPLKNNIMALPRFKDKESSAVLRIFTINGNEFTSDYLYRGIIKGLTKDAEYLFAGAFGSQNISFTANAEYHFFEEMEFYAEASYSTLYDNTYEIDVPDYLTSGYYMLNNGSFFRLVRGSSYDFFNTDEEQFNKKSLYLDVDYALANGGYVLENTVYDKDGNIVRNSDGVYSSIPELCTYYTSVEGALGYVPKENTDLDTPIYADEDEDIPVITDNMKTAYYKIYAEEPVPLAEDEICYSLTSKELTAPCVVNELKGDTINTLSAERQGEGYVYNSKLKGKVDLVYISVSFTDTASPAFETLHTGLSVEEVKDLSEVPAELIERKGNSRRN